MGQVVVSAQTWTGDGAERVVTLPRRARVVKLINATDRIVYEKSDTMADAKALKTIADGTATFETTALTLSQDIVTIPAAVNVDTKAMHLIAYG